MHGLTPRAGSPRHTLFCRRGSNQHSGPGELADEPGAALQAPPALHATAAASHGRVIGRVNCVIGEQILWGENTLGVETAEGVVHGSGIRWGAGEEASGGVGCTASKARQQTFRGDEGVVPNGPRPCCFIPGQRVVQRGPNQHTAAVR